MNYHLISDTHFNHLKLEEWGGRSGDWQDQLYRGLAAIPSGDVLIHMGDICIGNDEEIHKRLFSQAGFFLEKSGDMMRFGVVPAGVKRILVRGNHDKKSAQWYHEHGWDMVVDSFHLIFQGHYIEFSHRPQRQGDKYTHNIHGHTHGNLHRSEEYLEFYQPGYHIDVSPELVGYRPIRLDTLMKMKKEDRKYPTA